jgi:tetratricopeptide (TPR) repeat protein
MDSRDYVSGYVMAAVIGSSAGAPEYLGEILYAHCRYCPFTTLLCYGAYLGMMSQQFPRTNIESLSAESRIIQGFTSAGSYYLVPYWEALIHNLESRGWRDTCDEKELQQLNAVRDAGVWADIFAEHSPSLVWAAHLMAVKAKYEQAITYTGQMLDPMERLKVQSWMTENASRGANLIDLAYKVPPSRDELRSFLINLLRNGGDEDYWWTVSSAIEKLGTSVFVGDPIVCQALLEKLQEFRPAESAYATKQVGPFQLINVPAWPYGEKSIYQELADALAGVADKETANALELLLPTSPYPDAIQEALLRIASRSTDRIGSAEAGDHGPSSTKNGSSPDEQVEELFMKGKRCFDEEDYSQAVKRYRQALQFAPSEPNIHVNLASALIGCGQTAAALESCNNALASNPFHEPALFLKVQLEIDAAPTKRKDLLSRALLCCPLNGNLIQWWREAQ